MNPLGIFFVIHLFAYLALLLNVGIYEDGFDNALKDEIWYKRLKNKGIAAMVLMSVCFLAALVFFIYDFEDQSPNNNLYLGFLITFLTYTMPFVTTCHHKATENEEAKGTFTINLIGWITLLIGSTGLLGSVIAVVASEESLENYVSILGQFIAVTSALIALSGATIETHGDRSILTDLGKAAMLVIVIGFAVSIINAQIDDKKKEELGQTAKQTQKVLLEANNFITQKLKPNIDIVDSKIANTNRDLGNVVTELESILQQIQALNAIKKQIEVLAENVAKGKDLQEVKISVANYDNRLNQIENQVKQIENLQATVNAYQLKIQNIENQVVNQLAKQDQVQDLKTSLQNYTARLQNIEKIIGDISEQNQQIGDMKTRIQAIQSKLQTLESSNNDQKLNNIQISLDSLSKKIK